ncbi:MAG: aspartate carbamoyltransferase catalytic subunit [Bdellovibrionales bacterium]|nr:aspartate carbamoyltransferase catalytic subunit [Bdellovibrionales bacterium]
MASFPSLLESIGDLETNQIEVLLSRSKHFKNNPQLSPFSQTFPKPCIATSFLENSTRTKHSFAVAIQRLGGNYIDFNAESSSLKKGESLEETFLTLFHQGVNLCVFRTSVSHQMQEFKQHLPIKLVNGGDGVNEHPSQALLDLLTLLELESDIDGKTISIIGDIVHSRVAHSLMKLLPLFGLKIILNGPDEYLPKSDSLPRGVSILKDRDEAIAKSDFLYLLRIQKERHENNGEDTLNSYVAKYGVTLELLKKLNKLIPVLHPGPANIGVELDQALIKSSLYKGYLQVENSIPMRMAIIEAMLLNNDQNIGKINGEKF